MKNNLQDGLLLFDFKSSDHIEDEITVERMNAIKKAINANRIVKVVNGHFKRTSEGIVLVCDSGSSNKPTTIEHPWQVKPYTDPENPDAFMVEILGGLCLGNAPTFQGSTLAPWETDTFEIPGEGERVVFLFLEVEWNVDGNIVAHKIDWCAGYDIPGNSDAGESSSGYTYLGLARIEIYYIAENTLTMDITQLAFHNVQVSISPNNRCWFFGV